LNCLFGLHTKNDYLNKSLRSNEFVLTRRCLMGAASHFSVSTIFQCEGALSCAMKLLKIPFFEPMSKRRRGFPSETKVKRGVRIVHGDKLLEEKLGRNDPCPCGSNKILKRCCLHSGCF
jgi:hypothetical protein